jgi:hypothetical protein
MAVDGRLLKKHPVYTERSAEIFKKTRGLKTFEEL